MSCCNEEISGVPCKLMQDYRSPGGVAKVTYRDDNGGLIEFQVGTGPTATVLSLDVSGGGLQYHGDFTIGGATLTVECSTSFNVDSNNENHNLTGSLYSVDVQGPAGNIVLKCSGTGNGNVTLQPNGNGTIFLKNLRDFADDVAAAAGGIPVTGAYRTGSVVKVRVS